MIGGQDRGGRDHRLLLLALVYQSPPERDRPVSPTEAAPPGNHPATFPTLIRR